MSLPLPLLLLPPLRLLLQIEIQQQMHDPAEWPRQLHVTYRGCQPSSNSQSRHCCLHLGPKAPPTQQRTIQQLVLVLVLLLVLLC
jgi:hypothetical protein